MSLIQSAPFLRAYRFFPHRLLNGAARRLALARAPRPLVRAVIRAWVRHHQVDLSEGQRRSPDDFATLEELFLRRLRPDARPVDPHGIASPADGHVIEAGVLHPDATIAVKGRRLSLRRIVNGAVSRAPWPLSDYAGGRYAVIFLSPRGYHRIHMPVAGELVDVRWVGGRFFPQNERALAQIPGVYERNERAVLRLRQTGAAAESHRQLLLVLVGASLIGGIALTDAVRSTWVGPAPVPLARLHARGDEIAHFTFGSTVIVLLPGGRGGALIPPVGAFVRYGQRLWDDGLTDGPARAT